MITKGFDFGGVELVGVLNADNLLNNPDFRSAERAFQLLMQVAGRAGRRENPGTVVIQTAEPGHPVLQQVIAGDYEAMARQLTRRAESCSSIRPMHGSLNLLLRHRDRDAAVRPTPWPPPCLDNFNHTTYSIWVF